MYASIAKQLFENGYNCSQAVVLAFKDLINVDEKELLKLSLPLGGGLGRLRLTCGAASGLAVVLGLLLDSSDKDYVYTTTRELLKKFEEANGSLICKELLEQDKVIAQIGGKPEERTKEYYDNRPCSLIVYNAAKILEDYLIEQKIIKHSSVGDIML